MVRIGLIVASAMVLAACGTSRPAKDVASQSWSGDYRFQWMPGTRAAQRGLPVPQQVQIRPLTSTKDVPGAKAGTDGPQWVISFVGQPGKPLPLKPFKADDYRDMGWVQQRAAGQMACLETGAFLFVCRTAPGSLVTFGRKNDEQLTTKTGLFGVVLHQGSFELTPLD